MRLSPGLMIVGMVLSVSMVLVLGTVLIDPPRPLLEQVAFSPEVISPNADGVDDITEITYEISENAYVTMAFTNGDARYVFRERERRSAGEYRVFFSGIVDGYILPDEQIAGTVLRRLIPNGEYTWTFRVEAQDSGEVAEETGTLVVEDANAPLPLMTSFEIWPDDFTPNQDGISDRAMINVYLQEGAELSVYLLGPDGEQIYVARREEGREAGEPGRHVFDYEGGVDIGADPPPDGVYTVFAEARDDEGQLVQRTGELTIRDGGKPRAEIVGQTIGVDVVFDVMPYDPVYFSDANQLGALIDKPDDAQSLANTAITMNQGDMLVFKLALYNYGLAPIRTSGPPPGTVYQQTQRASSMGEIEQSGAWRVGIDCETATQDYPWRWAVGTEDDLYTEYDPVTGNTYYYLPPGARTEVWGAIRMTEIVEARNPQACWAGLIHEDVEVTLENSNVGRREVELVESVTLTDN